MHEKCFSGKEVRIVSQFGKDRERKRGFSAYVQASGIGCSRLQLPFTKVSLLTSPWTGTGKEQAWGMRHNPQMVMSLQPYLVMILRWSMTQIASAFPAGSPLI